MSWGCFGWQLPLPAHAAVQAIHVASAARLVRPLCVLPAAAGAPATFLSYNIPKFRSAMTLLDWPFAVVWPPAPLELGAATSDTAACAAVTLWLQAVLGWLVPTTLLALSVRPARGPGKLLRENAALAVGTLAQAAWCVVRVAALKYVH